MPDLLSDLMSTSASTWRDSALDPPVLPPELTTPPSDTSPSGRIRALRARHTLRRERAEKVYADSRSPARGWSVADERAVVRFVAQMIRRRGWSFSALVVLNALAAATALVVPRLLGELIDRVTEPGPAANLGSLAMLIVAVVAAQAASTFAGQLTSTLFGQNLLA